MQAEEKKIGRVFKLEFAEDDDFFGELNRFIREKSIRSGSVMVFGAMSTVDMAPGFRSADRHHYDVDRRHLEGRREFSGVGNISMLDQPPPSLGDVKWTEPQPYVHIHITVSGEPGKCEEVLIGHLSGGGMAQAFAEIYESI